MILEGAPRIEVGDRYLAPILLVDDRSPAEWWPLTISSQVRLNGDTVQEAPQRAESATAVQLGGDSIDEVRSAVQRQSPDPVANRYRDLGPAERIKLVMRERTSSGP